MRLLENEPTEERLIPKSDFFEIEVGIAASQKAREETVVLGTPQEGESDEDEEDQEEEMSPLLF